MDDAKKARRKALRAAQVATLGLALAGGCYSSHEVEAPLADAADAGPAAVGDLGREPSSDAGADLGSDMFAADAGAPCAVDEAWSECCERVEWRCDEANTWGLSLIHI